MQVVKSRPVCEVVIETNGTVLNETMTPMLARSACTAILYMKFLSNTAIYALIAMCGTASFGGLHFIRKYLRTQPRVVENRRWSVDAGVAGTQLPETAFPREASTQNEESTEEL